MDIGWDYLSRHSIAAAATAKRENSRAIQQKLVSLAKEGVTFQQQIPTVTGSKVVSMDDFEWIEKDELIDEKPIVEVAQACEPVHTPEYVSGDGMPKEDDLVTAPVEKAGGEGVSEEPPYQEVQVASSRSTRRCPVV